MLTDISNDKAIFRKLHPPIPLLILCLATSSTVIKATAFLPMPNFPPNKTAFSNFLIIFSQTINRHRTMAFFHTLFWPQVLQKFCHTVTFLVKQLHKLNDTRPYGENHEKLLRQNVRETTLKTFLRVFMTNAMCRTHDTFFFILWQVKYHLLLKFWTSLFLHHTIFPFFAHSNQISGHSD